MLVRLAHLLKAKLSILVMPLGIIIFVRLVQELKACSPMLVSSLFLPKAMFVRLVHFQKAFSPIFVTPSGMLMLIRLEQL